MVCIMFSYEQSEALIQDMARERVSLRGRLREKREGRAKGICLALSQKREADTSTYCKLKPRGKWIASMRKNVEQEAKQEYFPFSLPHITGLKSFKKETTLLSQSPWNLSLINCMTLAKSTSLGLSSLKLKMK